MAGRPIPPAANRVTPPQKWEDSQLLASAILGFGSILWKVVSAVSNVDFLLSIKEERFAVLFNFFENTGWWLLAIVGAIWAIGRYFSKAQTRKRAPDWGMLISSAIITFLFGALIAVRSSGTVPNVITSYGHFNGNTCVATLDTKRLLIFADDYKVALVCGLTDPAVDKIADDRIALSNFFTIPQNAGLDIQVHFGDKMQKAVTQAGLSVWHEAVLIPNGVSWDKIKSLSDVINLRGKIIDPAYYK
jgi:hypothetical protein